MRYLFLLLLPLFSLQASPHIAGYERFGDGAVLYSELGCANCHGGGGVEIPRTGPSFLNLANRIEHNWVVEFLKNPQKAYPGTSMPLLTNDLSADEVSSLALYLGSIQKGKPIKAQRHVNAERGSALYHEKGCVACHAPTEDYRGPEKVEISDLAVGFPDLQKKYSVTSLDDFLTNVSKYRPDGRMPHITLTKDESLDIAAHLYDFQGSDPRSAQGVAKWPAATKKQLDIGKDLFFRLNCASCHTVPGAKKAEISPIKKAEGKCIGDSPGEGHPWYDVTDQQRKDIVEFIQSGESDENHTFAALNCFACHQRDDIGGPPVETTAFFVGNESLGDSGKLPPPLTGIGHKLRTDWMENVFAGKPETRVRPYVKTQMPNYPAHAKKLAAWLAKIDAEPDAKALTSVSVDHLEDGRKLLGTNGGVNCVTCHNWGDKKSPGIPGPDISSLDKRLRPEWFREYLLNPAAYRPGTLMPPLWPGGQSMVPDVLSGDAEKQIAAIWHFIEKGEGIPEGYPDHSSGKFELIPKDRPVIQRTFLEKAGSKAILVGFPGGIHLAFDGLNGKPSLVWKGRFFDAYNTWFTRAAPFENPLSDDVYPFTPSGDRFRFRGYVLDSEGNPEFLLEKDGDTTREHYQVKDGKLIRTISYESGEAPAVAALEGVKAEVNEAKGKLTITYFAK